MVYRGLVQRASDVINPESKAFSRFPLLPDYEQEESPLRCISVSPDGRYVSVAGKVGFAHLSTISGRWRVMDTMEPASPESIYQRDAALQVKGGMCWYGNLLFLSTDLGESHEVLRPMGKADLLLDSYLPSLFYIDGLELLFVS